MLNKDVLKQHIEVKDHILIPMLESFTSMPQSILFLYSDQKKIIEVNEFDKDNAEKIRRLYLNILKEINPEIKYSLIGFSKRRKYYKIVISKIPLTDFMIEDESMRGELFGIPKCCVEKYVSENKHSGSLNSALRYTRQLDFMHIEDHFRVSISNAEVTCGYGFVPCKPRCKEAMKIKRLYDKIVKEYQNG